MYIFLVKKKKVVGRPVKVTYNHLVAAVSLQMTNTLPHPPLPNMNKKHCLTKMFQVPQKRLLTIV